MEQFEVRITNVINDNTFTMYNLFIDSNSMPYIHKYKLITNCVKY